MLKYKIIGLDVRPYRINYAVHETSFMDYKFEKDGSLYIPTSQQTQAQHNACLNQGFAETFEKMLEAELEADRQVFVYCESYAKYPFQKRTAHSYEWIHAFITEYFADFTEIIGIPIKDTDAFRRKMLKALEALEGWQFTRVPANYIAFIGGKEVDDQIWVK